MSVFKSRFSHHDTSCHIRPDQIKENCIATRHLDNDRSTAWRSNEVHQFQHTIFVLGKKCILLSIFIYVRNGHLDLVFGWCGAKIYKMCSRSVFLRHQCPQEWDAPVPGWHYLDARDRSRRLIAGGASGGDGDGALKIALHCSANSEHCILRRTGGNRCACQWVRRIKPLNFEVGVSD